MVKRYLSGFTSYALMALSVGFVLAMAASAPAAALSHEFKVLEPPQIENVVALNADAMVMKNCAVSIPARATGSTGEKSHRLRTWKPTTDQATNARAMKLLHVSVYSNARASPVPWRC